MVDFELYAGLASLTAGSVVIVDVDDTNQPIVFANQAFGKLTGFASNEILGQDCTFPVSNLANPRTVESMRRSMRTKTDGAFILEHEKKNGKQFHCFVSLGFLTLPSKKNICLSCRFDTRINNYSSNVFEELARFRGDVRKVISNGENPLFCSLLSAQHAAANAAKMAFYASIQSASLRSRWSMAA